MFLTTVSHGAAKQSFADAAQEMLDAFQGREAYACASLIIFLAAIVLGFLILIRGLGIGYRLALIPLSLLPFLIGFSGAIWEISFYHYGRGEGLSPDALMEVSQILILVPFGVLQSLLLLLLSFLTFIQTGNGQLAYVLPGRSIRPA